MKSEPVPYNIHIHTYSLGKDKVFLIGGGQAHIGAVAVAYPDGHRICEEAVTLPGHREKPLAAELARLAASQLNQAVTVIMGIHIDQATKQDIAEIVRCVREAMMEELKRVQAWHN